MKLKNENVAGAQELAKQEAKAGETPQQEAKAGETPQQEAAAQVDQTTKAAEPKKETAQVEGEEAAQSEGGQQAHTSQFCMFMICVCCVLVFECFNFQASIFEVWRFSSLGILTVGIFESFNFQKKTSKVLETLVLCLSCSACISPSG